MTGFRHAVIGVLGPAVGMVLLALPAAIVVFKLNRGEPLPGLWPVAFPLITGLIAASYVVDLWGRARHGGSAVDLMRSGQARWSTWVAAWCVLAAIVVFGAGADLAVGIVLGLLIIGWPLVCTIPRLRSMEVHSRTEVRCTTMSAFELVSDPHNWPKWFPEIELTDPVGVPVHLGSVIHSRVRADRNRVVVTEVVVHFDPGRRFGTRSAGRPNAESIYEFAGRGLVTDISHTLRARMTILEAVAGGVFARRRIESEIRARRLVAMDRMQALLETPATSPV